jgi:membrane fusion protein (multidrug efflux system)
MLSALWPRTARRALAGATGGIVLLLLAVSTAGCSDGQAADEAPSAPRATRVETLQLDTTTFQDAIEATGSVESLDDARLSAQSSGTVVELAPLGTTVEEGEVVARMDDDIAQASAEQARASLETARARFDLAEDNYERQEPLYRDSIISALEFQRVRAEYNQARAQLSQAQAALAQAEKQLRNTRVEAPFAGTVEEHFVDEGEQVAPGTPVARVVNTERVRVQVGVPERFSGDIKTGREARIEFQSYNVDDRTAPITFVGSTINPRSRTFPIEVELDNPDRALKPEMVARVVVPRATLEDVIVIPRTAVVRSEEGDAVFVVSRGDTTATAVRRSVTLGPAYGGKVVVDAGLRPGDEVVVLGQTDLTEGVALNVVRQYQSADEAAQTFNDSDMPAAARSAPDQGAADTTAAAAP